MTFRITVLIGVFLFFPTTGVLAQDTDDMMDFIDGRCETTADIARTLWPSWVKHMVHPYVGEGERISIAFNVNVVEDGR